MESDPSEDITRLLRALKDGSIGAQDLLYSRVYVQLGQIARQRLRKERKDHTLQPTELIHEAFLKLVNESERDIASRRHFFALASTVMRRILVDHARRKRASKRDPGVLPGLTAENGFAPSAIDLDLALEKLAKIDERQAKIVEMRFFGRFTEQEIAEVLGITSRTVKRDWVIARCRLFEELSGPEAK